MTSGYRGLTQERLMEVISYDGETGVFKWRTLGRGRRKNLVAGTKHHEGYWQINIDGHLYLAHRLAWLYVHGVHPEQDIDHINRDRSDTRICNLRPVTRKQNMENQGLRSDNTSGIIGVGWDRHRNKWRAQIRHNGRTIGIGRFPKIEEAIAARRAFESKLFTHSMAV